MITNSPLPNDLIVTKIRWKKKNMQKLDKTDILTLQILKTEHRELTLQEIAEKTGETPEKIKSSLWKLFNL
jgi:DNA-binding Lrp family transcriptional regulator